MTIQELFVPFEDELPIKGTTRFPTQPTIEWKAAFGDFFFRIKGADPQILWCDLGYTVTPKRPLPPQRATTLSKRVSRAFRGRSFFRVVPFADGDDWALVRPRRAVVKSPHQPTGAWWEWNAKFSIIGKTQFQWLSQSPEWFEQWLSEQQKKHEGLRQAREFARLSEEERQWAPAVAPIEVRQQWQQLAQALQLLAAPKEDTAPSWRISRRLGANKVQWLSLEIDVHIHSRISERTFKATLKLRDKLTTRFAIPLEFSRWRGLEPNGDQHFHHFPQFNLATGSMHEKMEAALLWRDFLVKSPRREELEEALSELIP